MPESRNTTLIELSGRYQVAGVESILQRYPDTKHFLIVPPDGESQPPLVWTSQNLPLCGTTEMPRKDREKLLLTFVDDSTVIVPIQKSSRNEEPNVILGRNNAADIRLKSESVSKRHASLKLDNDRVYVSDLDSTNGTFINNHRIMENSAYSLSPGQEIKFSETRTVYLDLEHVIDLVKLATER